MKRHAGLNEIVARNLMSMGFHTVLDPPGLSGIEVARVSRISKVKGPTAKQ